MKQVWCRGCHGWFDAKLRACDSCGTERYGFSSHLYAAKLNNHLYAQAEKAEAEKKQYAAIKGR